ncbi:hypothetical protein GCM10008906_28220 [Clostridium oceanicum]|uniref:Uncharacterized protein n=1 Tax=Clostridium oceanicum TaxID=1543 RepID=A0ABP3UWM1_9CLOT
MKGRDYMNKKIVYVNFKKKSVCKSNKRPFLLFLLNFLKNKLVSQNNHDKSIKLIHYNKHIS